MNRSTIVVGRRCGEAESEQCSGIIVGKYDENSTSGTMEAPGRGQYPVL